MIYKKIQLLVVVFSLVWNVYSENPSAKKSPFTYAGRVEVLDQNKVVLVGSASSVSFHFEGNYCEISLQSVENHQNYVSLELDGKYIGRMRIEKGQIRPYPITVSENIKVHHLTIYKATEAANGGVLFAGTTAKLAAAPASKNRKKIELIGDSITCGMGNDATEFPCYSGDWYDQHNAYWSYGSILARALNADYILSSVSGHGMYRNWNDEHIDEAIIPEVYENLYLNRDKSKPYHFAFQPDLVSICLGTNDLSDGDGKKTRLPFNEEKYIANYIQFIQTVYAHAPNTRVVLLSSPMVSGEKNETLIRCLKKVILAFESDKKHQPIALFQFQPMVPKGCGYHPDIEDDTVMAEQLTPFFKKLLDEK